MALSLVSNISSLISQYNLSQAQSSLNTSLQKLSTGLQINNGADGPAAQLISQQQSAQVAGLSSAINNTSNQVNAAQAADGALNAIGSLLTQVRGLAVNSAGLGASDTTTLAANQAQIQNALSAINGITQTTKYGGVTLFSAQSQSSLIFNIGSGSTAASGAASGSAPSASTAAQEVSAYTSPVGSAVSSLSSINVESASGADDALKVIDAAIAQVGAAESNVGAFQANTLQATTTNLQASLQNTTSAESVVQDTNFQSEISNFTQQSVQLQAGASVLSNANLTSSVVSKLLSGLAA